MPERLRAGDGGVHCRGHGCQVGIRRSSAPTVPYRRLDRRRCARGAVLKAAKEALEDGRPRLVSVQPEDLLAEHGVKAGAERDGVRFARNMCPSRGRWMCCRADAAGAGPYHPGASRRRGVADRVALRFPRHGLRPQAEQAVFDRADARIDGFMIDMTDTRRRYVVVSTQGRATRRP